MRYLKRIIFLFIFVLVSFQSHAVNEHFIQAKSISKIQDDLGISNSVELIVEDQFHQCYPNCPWEFELASTNAYTKLWIDDSKLNRNIEYTLEVEYALSLYKNYTSTNPDEILSQIVSVNYHPSQKYKDVELTVISPDFPLTDKYTKVDAEILSVRFYDVNGDIFTLPYPAKNIHFEVGIEVERIFKLRPKRTPRVLVGSFNATSNELTVAWDYLHGAEYYDLEWLFIDNPASLEVDFDFNNATRVSTKANSYSISMAYPEGVLLFRTRGVGLEQSASGKFDKRVEGPWSTVTKGTTNQAGGNMEYKTVSDGLFFSNKAYVWAGLEPDKNWQYSAVFAEDGKRKEVISFYDGILKTEQTATILNTDNFAVVVNPVYDYIGRDAMQILPSPQPSQGISYYNPLHYNQNGDEYSYVDFDYDSKIDEPTPLKANDNLGAGNYYSRNSAMLGESIHSEYTPDAQGYPFSRTIFKNDGTGRVKEQTGIGFEYYKNNQLNHSFKYYYSAPLQNMLFYLFGNEVGFAKYYEKVVSVDPNGQASAMYKDLSGRVIATSLIGDAPSNLKEIDTKPDQFDRLRDNLSQMNEVIGDELIINHSITVVGNTRYDFKYTLPKSLFENCAPSFNCIYDLEIYVLDEYGNRQTFTNNTSLISRDSISKVSNPIIGASISLTTGTYQIVKVLKLNSGAIQEARQHFINNQTCYEPEKVDTITSCEPNCEALCYSGYFTPVNDQGIQYVVDENFERIGEINTLSNDTTKYNASAFNIVMDSIASCISQCEAPAEIPYSNCDVKYELLAGDMSPGGQYFDNLPFLNTANFHYHDWLFNNISQQEMNQIATCIGMDVPSKGFNKYDFWLFIRLNWQNEWADLLIKYHPEWCAFQNECCAQSNCVNTDEYLFEEKVLINYGDTSAVSNEATPGFTYSDSICIDTIKNEVVARMNISETQQSIDYTFDAQDPNSPHFLTRQEIEDRVESFYYEYYKYHYIKDRCANLYIQSPDSNGLDVDSFMIRYPENWLFEQFDPDDPSSIEEMADNSCEQQANAYAQRFRNELKCGDLTLQQENDLVDFAFEQALLDCTSDTIDLSYEIDNYIQCNHQLPLQCYVQLLPEEDSTWTSCECEQLYSFMHAILKPEGYSYTSVVTSPTPHNNLSVQDAMKRYLTGADTAHVTDFNDYVVNCNQYNNWYGSNDTATFKLAVAFQCDSNTFAADSLSDEDCVKYRNELSLEFAQRSFETLLNQKANEYVNMYANSCLNQAAAQERFNMYYEFNEYHFTLFYYDQAANLIKTIPPEGTYQQDLRNGNILHKSLIADQSTLNKCWQHLNDTSNYPFVHPKHVMQTNYVYNSLNQITAQSTPDGGTTKMWYDALGRLVVSQNVEQLNRSAYSYLKYDVLGRTIEAGELEHATPMTKEIAEDVTDYNNINGNNMLLNWYNTSIKYQEVTQTYYDKPPSFSPLLSSNQKNLRNRIAMVTYDDNVIMLTQGTVRVPDYTQYTSASHYSYDIQGNVDTIYQENKRMPAYHQLKKMHYEYDLLSGNVNALHYQSGQIDAHHLRYNYDADNRLTRAESSRNEMIWKTDAKYFYYAHGPLAREEIGHTKVFANDYVYDIRGFITAMNASTLDKNRDAGKDGVQGLINENIGKDPFAYSLHYFDKHYQPIDPNASDVLINTNKADMNTISPGLYNGNISQMVVSICNTDEQTIPLMANAFRYDQLNRIKQNKPFWDKDGADKPLIFNELVDAQKNGEYYTKYTYDGNGNIYSLLRTGVDDYQQMDLLAYNYKHLPNGAKLDNKLYSVDDWVSNSNYALDITDQNPNNYAYDDIGRLIQDKAEGIKTIQWNVGNKVSKIERGWGSNKAELAFYYGPMGNRIAKEVKETSGAISKSYYVLDAQGNPIAIYKMSNGILKLEELLLYGNKRLGTRNLDVDVNDLSAPSDQGYNHSTGSITYETTDHRNNIYNTTTDQKLFQQSTNSFTADVTSFNDYYPFGMIMPGRTDANGEYRYGFNGMEKDDKVKDIGNSYNYGARMYDNRVGRWLSTDPMGSKQPAWSPYKMAKDNPILFQDPDGNTEIITLIVNNRKTGESTIFKVGVSEDVIARMNIQTAVHYWHDIDHTYVIDIDKAGQYSMKSYIQQPGKKRGNWWFTNKSDFRTDKFQKWGWYLTSKDGEGTSIKGKNILGSGNIDEILGLIQDLSSIQEKTIKGKDNVTGGHAKIKDIVENSKIIVETYDRGKAISDETERMNNESNSSSVSHDYSFGVWSMSKKDASGNVTHKLNSDGKMWEAIDDGSLSPITEEDRKHFK